MKPFVHLHVHTEYSLLDGAARIKRLFELCDKMNMPAVAITDHGNMYGAMEFFRAAAHYGGAEKPYEDKVKYKVKPIFGCEVYMCENMDERKTVQGKAPKLNHFVLLAKNEAGYHNLLKIVSAGYVRGMYYKPRVDFECLKAHSEGIIALSGCLAGVIPQAILAGDFETASMWIRRYKELYGDDFYVELQNHNIKEQQIVLPHLIRLANENGVKTVATNDAHYLTRKDAVMQKVLMSVAFHSTLDIDALDNDGGWGSSIDGNLDEDSYFPTNEFYIKNYDEMLRALPNLQESLDRTVEIANKCEALTFKKESLLPKFIPEDGSTPSEYLRKLTFDGLKRVYPKIDSVIKERAEYELGIINSLNFVDYFLIVWDFIHYSESVGIPVGPGRGSGAGSIVAYAIGITKIDPIKHNLYFERFLNPERVSNPDFDIDFCVDRRGEVIKYVNDKYGNVSQIATFSTMMSKAAIKDVGRVLRRPFEEMNKITKCIPRGSEKMNIRQLLGQGGDNDGVAELKEIYDADPMSKKVLDMAAELEGMPRQIGMHAAGVIICRDPIDEHVPLARTSEDAVVTQYNMTDCEALGLLKMDFLGLTTLTDIDKAVKLIKKTHGIELNFYDGKFTYDDPEIYKLMASGDTDAVFQLESPGMKRFMSNLVPDNLEDIIAGISLYRPGPMDYIPQYVANKKNPDAILYEHPLLKPILGITYGVIVYQEQVMEIFRAVGGYTMGRADEVRRFMSKKKLDAMKAEREIFLYGNANVQVDTKKDKKSKDAKSNTDEVNNKENDKDAEKIAKEEPKVIVPKVKIPGAVANGVSPDVADEIYEKMKKFANYGFNKSHATAYAYLTYQTAFLKRYYMPEYFAAVMNNRIDTISELTKYLTYLKTVGVEVLPPSINKSESEFSVENGKVRIGLSAIKNVGARVIESIIAERESGGEFIDFPQFIKRICRSETATVNKRMLENLIYAGAFDCFGKKRSQLIAVCPLVIERESKDAQALARGQLSMFDIVEPNKDDVKYPDIDEYPNDILLSKEKEVTGIYLSGHPLMSYVNILNSYRFNTSMLYATPDNDEIVLEDGAKVVIPGMLTDTSHRITKRQTEMGTAKLMDMYGTVEILVTGDTYSRVRDLWKDETIVVVKGKVSYRDDMPSVWVDSVELLDVGIKENKKLFCRYDFSDVEAENDILEIAKAYVGEDELIAYDPTMKGQKTLTNRFSVCKASIMELAGVVGKENVKEPKPKQ